MDGGDGETLDRHSRTPLFLKPLYSQGLLYSNVMAPEKLPFQGYFFQTQSIIYNQLCDLFGNQDLFDFGVLKIKCTAGFLQAKYLIFLNFWLMNQITNMVVFDR